MLGPQTGPQKATANCWEVALGQAKLKALRRKTLSALSQLIKAARFDLFTMGSRLAATRLVAEELSYWSDKEEESLAW